MASDLIFNFYYYKGQNLSFLPGQLVLQGPPAAIAALGQEICQKLDGKGNGKNNKFQAKVGNLKKVKECEEAIKAYFNKE
jgi:hypothetical protein